MGRPLIHDGVRHCGGCKHPLPHCRAQALRFKHTRLLLEHPVAVCPAGHIDRSRHIGTGDLGQSLHAGATFGARAHVASVEQKITADDQAAAHAGPEVGIVPAIPKLEILAAQGDPARATVADDVDRVERFRPPLEIRGEIGDRGAGGDDEDRPFGRRGADVGKQRRHVRERAVDDDELMRAGRTIHTEEVNGSRIDRHVEGGVVQSRDREREPVLELLERMGAVGCTIAPPLATGGRPLGESITRALPEITKHEGHPSAR